MKKLLSVIIPPFISIIGLYLYTNLLELIFIKKVQLSNPENDPPPFFFVSGMIILLGVFLIFIFVHYKFIIQKINNNFRSIVALIYISLIISFFIGILFGFIIWDKQFGFKDLLIGILLISSSLFVFALTDILSSLLIINIFTATNMPAAEQCGGRGYER